MSEWRETTLGEICELKRGYDLPESRRLPGSFPIVSSSGITGFHVEAKVPGPGVVTGRYGTLGRVYYIKKDFWPLNTALYVRDFKGNRPKFVAALLETMGLGQNEGATAVPGVNRNDLHRIPVRIPDVETQGLIVEILSSIDISIENNRRRIELLERMAQAIYREWFVHFRYPGHESVPLVESTQGTVPSGWLVRPIKDLVRIIRVSVLPTDVEPEFPAVGLEHIPRKRITLDSWGRAEDVDSRKTFFQSGDILFSKIRPYFHKVSVAPLDGICSTDALVIRPMASYYGFVVMLLFGDEFIFHAVQTSNGTKMPRADWKVIGEYLLAVPPESLAREYAGVVDRVLDQCRCLMLADRRLAAMRDLLLPKLITGEIDVSKLDLDSLLETVA